MHNSTTPRGAHTSHSVRSRFSPNQQIGYGCLAIAVIGAMVMYCAGTLSILIRPNLEQHAPTPTLITRTAFASTATKPPPTFIDLPGGTLLATPTQAPIPTREWTHTPTVELTNTFPITGTLTPPSSVTRGSATATRTPTRRATDRVTLTPRP